jgi:cell division protein FtsA
VKSKNNIITVLDIGTTKIVCLIAIGNNNNDIRIIGASTQLANGFKAGVVTNLKQAEYSVASAIESAEKMANEQVSKVVVSLCSGQINSSINSSTVHISNHPINDRDIGKVISQALEQYNKSNEDIIHYFPLEYSIDNQNGIKDPSQMFGNNLTCKIHLISAPSGTILNLANCLARCQLDTEDFIVAPYASAVACLTADETELGALIIDLGGTTSSFAIYSDNNFIYTDSVPIGGFHITSDIAQCFSINLSQAERIKILHGNVISTSFDEHKIIEIPASNDEWSEQEISSLKVKDLSSVIKPRTEEIFEMIKHKLDQASFKRNIPKRIILTGGACQLHGLKELASYVLGGQVRIASPKNLIGLPEQYRGPAFSTAIGMLNIINENLVKTDILAGNEHEGSIKKIFKKLFKWM